MKGAVRKKSRQIPLCYTLRDTPWIDRPWPAGETQYWLLVTEADARALADGIVPAAVAAEASQALRFELTTRKG